MTNYTKITDNDYASGALYDKVNDMADALNAGKLERTAVGVRKASNAYLSGDIVMCEYHPDLLLKCTTAGTTAVGALDTSGTLYAGNTISDGTVVWTAVKVVDPTGTNLFSSQNTFTGNSYFSMLALMKQDSNLDGGQINFEGADSEPNYGKNCWIDRYNGRIRIGGYDSNDVAHNPLEVDIENNSVTSVTPSAANDQSIKVATTEWKFNNDNLYRTNCITEIPQDIKLEIDSNGKCWLRAGSKCYKPDGTAVTIENDLAVGRTTSNQEFVAVNGDGTSVGFNVPPASCYSGTSAPTGFSGFGAWLDTTNNVIKISVDGGSTWTTGDYCLPFALVTMKNVAGEVNSIDNVFNGFGYFGSTVFALPGVKGLIPNGRNADGTLRNNEVFLSYVLTKTFTGDADTNLLLYGDLSINEGNAASYDEKANINNYGYGDTNKNFLIYGSCRLYSGRVSLFKTKTAFRALDWSETNDIQSAYLSSIAKGKYKTKTLLMSTSTGSGNITLSQPYTNFDALMIVYTDDSSNDWTTHIVSSDELNIRRSFNGTWRLLDGATYWACTNASTTTSFVYSYDNGIIKQIYGINF